MGHREFGNLGHTNRVIYFGLSPYEQKAYKNAFVKGIPAALRRYAMLFLVASPGVGAAIYSIKWSKAKNLQLSRKQPGQFDNDK